MTRIAVLLVVFALTGAPIANAVCLTRCHSQLMTENCDELMGEPAISAGGGPCPTLLADTPFVREDLRSTFDRVALAIVHPTVTPLTRERPSHVQRDARDVDGRRMQSIALRL